MISTFEFAGHVVGVIVKANTDSSAFSEISELIKSKIEEHGKINLFLEIERGCTIPLSAMIKHLKFSVENAGSFKKIAVVTNSDSFKNTVFLKDILIKAEVEAFSHENRLEAMSWIAQ